MADRAFAWWRDMGPVFLVVVAVVLVFTVGESVFGQFRQVAAEDVVDHPEIAAVVNADKTQELKIAQWGVALVLPQDSGQPVFRYAVQGPDSVGLTSDQVEKIDGVCTAGHSSLGAIVRVSTGTTMSRKLSQAGTLLGTVGEYDYVYETPTGVCAATQASDEASSERISIAGNAVLVSR
jgi:hypothetical protein